MPFLDSLDIANRSCQILGQNQILSVTEDSKQNQELSFAYDKLRRAELRRSSWRFAIKNVVLRSVLQGQSATATQAQSTSTMLLQPAQYNAATVYLMGAIVQDTNSVYWISMQDENVGNTPGGNNEMWEAYYGSLTVQPWVAGTVPMWLSTVTYGAGNQAVASDGYVYTATTTSLNRNPANNGNPTYWTNTGSTAASFMQGYYAGELVYIQSPQGAGYPLYTIYMSLQNGNTDQPNLPQAWVSTTTYYGDQVVSYSGSLWFSLIELNIGNIPVQAPNAWSAAITYSSGQTVSATDGFVYSSATNSNTGNNPAFNANSGQWTNTGTIAAWSQSPSPGYSDLQWAVISQAAMKSIVLPFPLPVGFPTTGSFNKNVYRLPANFLRRVNPDPKAGTVSMLGAPTGRMMDDWELQGNFLTTMDPGPITLRFVADVVKVRDMDDLYCEGLAARMAFECCETITQATDKQVQAQRNYDRAMGEARAINAIEIGPEEAPEDDWITTRL